MTGAGSVSAEGLPAVREVVDAFWRALQEHAQRPSGLVLGLLLDLHSNNLAQWQHEDVTRAADADDATVAAAKRAIDALNATRHRLVEAVDVVFANAIQQELSAIPATESPAMVFDRLSVLAIRIHYTARAARLGGADRDVYAGRLPLLRQQLTVVQKALDGLLDDVRSGRKCFLPYQSLKLYGTSPSSSESTSP